VHGLRVKPGNRPADLKRHIVAASEDPNTLRPKEDVAFVEGLRRRRVEICDGRREITDDDERALLAITDTKLAAIDRHHRAMQLDAELITKSQLRWAWDQIVASLRAHADEAVLRLVRDDVVHALSARPDLRGIAS
jgi:hypothetical protein